MTKNNVIFLISLIVIGIVTTSSLILLDRSNAIAENIYDNYKSKYPLFEQDDYKSKDQIGLFYRVKYINSNINFEDVNHLSRDITDKITKEIQQLQDAKEKELNKNPTIGNDLVNLNKDIVNVFDNNIRIGSGNDTNYISSPALTCDVTIDIITELDRPRGIAYDPTNQRVYVVNQRNENNYSNDTVSVIDTNTNTIIGNPILVGNLPQTIVSDPVNKRMYVTNFDDNTVSVIDTNTNTIIGNPILVGSQPVGMAFDSNNNRIYVSNAGDNTVSVIDTNTNTIIGNPILVGSQPVGMAFDSNNNRIYVANIGSNNISIIDTNTNKVIDNPITVGNLPSFIAYDPINQRIYVTNRGDNSVSVIDTSSNNLVDTILAVGEQPNGIEYVNERIYVINHGNPNNHSNDTVSVIDTNTNKVIDNPITVGNFATLSAYDPINKRIYVTNQFDNTVSVIKLC